MNVRLYNTLTRQKEPVQPVNGIVTIYTCGPTVYDYPHIGNWYAFIRWDMLHRALVADGYKTQWLMNITDVGHLVSDADDGEDKLEKGAKREGKTAWDVAKYYGDYFIDGLKKLQFSEINMLPKATDHIQEQINMVKVLEDKGVTYIIDDGVYFDTSKIDDYGKLAHLNLNEQRAGARVEFNPQKRNASDFALWKFSPKGEKRDMEWDSPWGIGFPGWHIECSAMAIKYLGETISIHGGGIDHIPVHHTNEIAQSETATDKPFAHTWVHSNFILVDGKKMSKSLGNFYTLEDIEKQGYTAEEFRFAVISSHYQSEAEFSWDTMHAARIRLQRIKEAAALQYQANSISERINLSVEPILEVLRDNLNTPEAVMLLDNALQNVLDKGIHNQDKDAFVTYLQNIQQLFGIQLSIDDITDDIRVILADRQKARDDKQWDKSDLLRDQLLSNGIKVRDTKIGQIWSRV